MFDSEFEANLYQLRLDKLRQIEALGQPAYPNRFPPEPEPEATPIPTLRAQFIDCPTPPTAEQLEHDKPHVVVAGRLMQIRVQGKAGFAQLQQGGQRLQIYVRKDDVGEDQFAIYKLLDLGDHIGVHGYLFVTRTGETTVHVTRLTFLAKALLALPDKYHGLEDLELRYRQRYVDLFMNTGSKDPEDTTPNVREVFVKRAAVVRALRTFFDSRGYIEVETPMMHPVLGGATARPFTTHHNALDLPLYLRIAPELYLKRLVVGGLDRVYEINRNFRNEGLSTQHNPEFTMLEFYQAYANYHDLMQLTEEIVTFVATEVNGTTICNFNGHTIDLSKWTRLSMRDAIIKFWPADTVDPPTHEDFANIGRLADVIAHASDVLGEQLRYESSVAQTTGDYTKADRVASIYKTFRASESHHEIGKLIAEVFEILAEPHLIQPTIIYDFPRAVSPLSKVKPEDPEWTERFEFYIGGFEVGNAFSELNDPVDQRQRFEDQLKEKAKGDDEAMEMDEDYVRALGYGLPPTAGEGIGIDRLTMILTGSRSIRDVILFPLLRPVNRPTDN